MNSRQLQYVVALSENLNISQTAEGLKISQPALSKQILTLEEELGVVLFDRSVTPLKLTEAGESFIRDAKDLLFREEQLKHSMEDYKNGAKGTVVIGISPFRALYFISDIVKKLHEKYPGLKVVLKEIGSAQLHKEAAEGLVDFAIVNLPADKNMLDIIPLEKERLVLAMPKVFSSRLNLRKTNAKLPSVSLKSCKEIPFIATGKNQELRQLFDKLCLTNDFTPNITTEVVGITTAWSLCNAGVGACVLPYRFIEGNGMGESIQLFSIKGVEIVREPAIIMRKGAHISKFTRDAIEFIKNR